MVDYDALLTAAIMGLLLAAIKAATGLLQRREDMSKAHPRYTRNNQPLAAAAANLFEVAVIGDLEGQTTINTFYYNDGGATLNSTSEQTLATAFRTALMTLYKAACSSDWTWTGVKVSCLTSPARMPVIDVTGAGAGTGPAGHEPSQIGVVIMRLSGVKGQAGRGRVTIPAVPSGWVTGSLLTTGAAHLSLAGGMLATFVSGAVTYTPMVVSRKNKAGPTLGAATVLRTTVGSVLGSVRRRKIGKGS